MKEILVLPISGGSFHIQLFLSIELIKAGCKKPEIILGTSGGSINSHILLYSGWNINNIKRVLSDINSNVYSKSWWYKPLDNIFPSYILGYFKGSLYNNGEGLYGLFNLGFNNVTVKDIEIWTLKVNFKTMKGKLSCNKDNTTLNINNYNYSHNNIEDIVFNNGDIDKISNDCISSCSIPMIVPAKKDGDNYYIDGGMLYASPLTPLMSCISSSTNDFHIAYVSSFNMEDNNINCIYGNILNNTKHTIDNIMLGPSLLDRMNAIKLISSNPIYEEGSCDTDKLSQLLLERLKYSRTLIELYPNEYINLDINNFNNENINVDYRKLLKCGYSYRFWHC